MLFLLPSACRSVGRSLERLALWRAAHSGSRAARTSGGQPLGFLYTMVWGKKQDNVLFKVGRFMF